VDTSDRADVVDFFESVYEPAFDPAIQWTGDVDQCIPGTTSAAHTQATLDLVNYFRAMAGLSGDIVFDPGFSAMCQEAALMMSAENALSHGPMPGWACYTADGATAAGKSNLALGIQGPGAIAGYIEDPGAGNTVVGHRRWILLPPQTTMGTGSIANVFPHSASNALYVVDLASWAATPVVGVPWPPAGFVPYEVVYPRWSFQIEGGDFSSATVSMTQGGSPVTLQVIGRPSSQFPDPAVVWEPNINPGAGDPDTTYSVHVEYELGGLPESADYDVTIIDPTLMPEPSAIASGVAALVALGLLAPRRRRLRAPETAHARRPACTPSPERP
jgi:hypothetical protein